MVTSTKKTKRISALEQKTKKQQLEYERQLKALKQHQAKRIMDVKRARRGTLEHLASEEHRVEAKHPDLRKNSIIGTIILIAIIVAVILILL